MSPRRKPYSLEFLDDYVAYRDQVERWTITEASDPRFSGDVMLVSSVRNYQEPSDVWLARRTARIESTDGAWQGRPTNEYWFRYRGLPFTMVFTGEGAYEGWTILALATPQTGMQIGLEGHIIGGRLPAAPEIPPE